MGKKKQQKYDTTLADTDELLAELATLDEVSAVIPTATEHDHGIYPAWCELLLTIKRLDDGSLKPSHPLNARLPLRRHDGELIIEVLDQVLHPQRNERGVAAIWDALDAAVDRIQARINKDKAPRPADVGEARGLAVALATYTSSRDPDVDEVRAEAMARWDARHGVA